MCKDGLCNNFLLLKFIFIYYKQETETLEENHKLRNFKKYGLMIKIKHFHTIWAHYITCKLNLEKKNTLCNDKKKHIMYLNKIKLELERVGSH